MPKRSKLLKARGNARNAKAELESISGFRAVAEHTHDRIEHAQKEDFYDEIADTRRAVEDLRDQFDDAAERAKTHPHEWDHATDKLVRSRLDAARARLRIWLKRSGQ